MLKAAGVVADEKRGTLVYHRLKTPCVLNFVACTETVMKTRLAEQLAFMETA